MGEAMGWLVAWLLGCLVAWLLGCLVAWLLGCLVAWWLGLRNFIGTFPPFSMPETFAKYLAQDARCKRGTFSLT